MLGIEYERYFAQPFLDIFIRGEKEWLEKAPDTYGEDADEVWAGDIFESILAGHLTQTDIEDLRLYTPEMITALFSEQIEAVKNQTLKNILNALQVPD